MSGPRVLHVGTIDEDNAVMGWVFKTEGEAPLFALNDDSGAITIAGFTLEELRVLVAEGSPDEGVRP